MNETSSVKISYNKIKKKVSWKGDLTLNKFESVMSQIFGIDLSNQIIIGFTIEHVGFISINDFINRKNEFIQLGAGKDKSNIKPQKKLYTLYMRTEKLNHNLMNTKDFSKNNQISLKQSNQADNTNNYENSQQTSANHSQNNESPSNKTKDIIINKVFPENQNYKKKNYQIFINDKNLNKVTNVLSMGKPTYLVNTRIDEIISQEDISSKGSKAEYRSSIHKKTSDHNSGLESNQRNYDVKRNISCDKRDSIIVAEHISPISIRSENFAQRFHNMEQKLTTKIPDKFNDIKSNFDGNNDWNSPDKKNLGINFCPIFEVALENIDTLPKVKTYFKKEPFLSEKIIILFKIKELVKVHLYQKNIGSEIKDYQLLYSIQNVKSDYQTISVIIYGELQEEIKIPENDFLLENHYKETQSLILNSNINEKLRCKQSFMYSDTSIDSKEYNNKDRSSEKTLYTKNSLDGSEKEQMIEDKINLKNTDFIYLSSQHNSNEFDLSMIGEKKIKQSSVSEDSNLSQTEEKQDIKKKRINLQNKSQYKTKKKEAIQSDFDSSKSSMIHEEESQSQLSNPKISSKDSYKKHKNFEIIKKPNDFLKPYDDETTASVDKILSFFEEGSIKKIQDFLEEDYNLDHSRRKICNTILNDNNQLFVFMIENCIRGFYSPTMLTKKFEQISMVFDDQSELMSESKGKSEIDEDDFIGQKSIDKKTDNKITTSDIHINLNKELKNLEQSSIESITPKNLNSGIINTKSFKIVSTKNCSKLENIAEVSQVSMEDSPRLSSYGKDTRAITIIDNQQRDLDNHLKAYLATDCDITQEKSKFLESFIEKDLPKSSIIPKTPKKQELVSKISFSGNDCDFEDSLPAFYKYQNKNPHLKPIEPKLEGSFYDTDSWVGVTSNKKISIASQLSKEDASSKYTNNETSPTDLKMSYNNSIINIDTENLNAKMLQNIRSSKCAIKEKNIFESLPNISDEKKVIFNYIFKHHNEISKQIWNSYQNFPMKLLFVDYLQNLYKKNDNELVRIYLVDKFLNNDVLKNVANESHKNIFIRVLNKEETIAGIDYDLKNIILDSYEYYLVTLDEFDFWENIKYSGFFEL